MEWRLEQLPLEGKAFLGMVLILVLGVLGLAGAVGLVAVGDNTDLLSNMKLAHVHLNGHAFLFFIVGLPFLFSRLGRGGKIAALAVLFGAVLVHTGGLMVHDTLVGLRVTQLSAGVLSLAALFMGGSVAWSLKEKSIVKEEDTS